MDRTHVVYRCFAANGELLYIGQTGDVRWRCYAHKCRTEWWPRVARITTTRPTTHRAALRYERLAIRAEQPTHNIAHKADQHGTPNRYNGLDRCRCDECRAAATAYKRTQRQRPKPVLEHGTVSMAANFGCRCDPCHAAVLERVRKNRSAA